MTKSNLPLPRRSQGQPLVVRSYLDVEVPVTEPVHQHFCIDCGNTVPCSAFQCSRPAHYLCGPCRRGRNPEYWENPYAHARVYTGNPGV